MDAAADRAEGSVELVETHISMLFFTADRAYKVLKPISSGFLDNSTRPQRHRNIHAELVLNRRLAPDVYLGVLDVVRDGVAVEHVLEMVRMPAARRLSVLVVTEEGREQLREVARAVAKFHASLPPVADGEEFASWERVAARWRHELGEMAELASPWLPAEQLEEVGALAEQYVTHRAPLFDQRIAEGYVRDGHGDLLADDIFCLDDGPRILDCLAFDTSLRVGDVLADIAFLVMDVERLAGAQAADHLLSCYQDFGGELHPSSLAHHYVASRALVRAKVAAVRAAQGGPSGAQAGAFLTQCREHLWRGRVRLILVGGAPGTGKSTLAEALGAELGAVVQRSDELRKELAGLGHRERTADTLDEGLYSSAWTKRTYEELVDRAGQLLAHGESVVLDARWSERWQRFLARDVARRHGADVIEVECHLPLDVARERVRARFEADRDASDVGPELMDRLTSRQAPWPEAIPVETSRPVGDLVGDLLAHVELPGIRDGWDGR